MQMGMMLEGLAPGVEHGEEADVGPQVLRVPGDGAQRGRGGSKQHPIEQPFVLEGQRAERSRQGADDVEVGHRQEVGGPRREPRRPGGSLTLGTVAVAAGVVGEDLVAAGGALLFVAAQGGGAAPCQIAQQATLAWRGPVACLVGRGGLREDLGHLGPRPGHRAGGSVAPARRSVVPGIPSRAVATWR